MGAYLLTTLRVIVDGRRVCDLLSGILCAFSGVIRSFHIRIRDSSKFEACSGSQTRRG